MSMAPVGDVRIHYQVQGHGDPLLLIMGYRASSHMWGAEFLKLLSRFFQVITFDNRGTGESDKPNTVYTLPMMADDAAGLLRYLGIARAHVFGVSMGGMIAQEVVLRYPRQVHRLILGCTTCGGPQAIVPPISVIETLLSAPHLPRREAIRRQWPIMVSPACVEQNAAFLDRMSSLALMHPTPHHTAIRQMMAVQRFNT